MKTIGVICGILILMLFSCESKQEPVVSPPTLTVIEEETQVTEWKKIIRVADILGSWNDTKNKEIYTFFSDGYWEWQSRSLISVCGNWELDEYQGVLTLDAVHPDIKLPDYTPMVRRDDQTHMKILIMTFPSLRDARGNKEVRVYELQHTISSDFYKNFQSNFTNAEMTTCKNSRDNITKAE